MKYELVAQVSIHGLERMLIGYSQLTVQFYPHTVWFT